MSRAALISYVDTIAALKEARRHARDRLGDDAEDRFLTLLETFWGQMSEDERDLADPVRALARRCHGPLGHVFPESAGDGTTCRCGEFVVVSAMSMRRSTDAGRVVEGLRELRDRGRLGGSIGRGVAAVLATYAEESVDDGRSGLNIVHQRRYGHVATLRTEHERGMHDGNMVDGRCQVHDGETWCPYHEPGPTSPR